MEMATTVTNTETLPQKRSVSGRNLNGGNGTPGRPGNNGQNGNHGRGGRHTRPSYEHFRVATWVGLAAIAMMFTALTSAYIVRTVSPEGKNDWHAMVLPRILWSSTLLILASSASFEVARRALKSGDERRYRSFLLLTIALGLGFLSSQLIAWRQLVAQGVYIATNPYSSFFYLLTGVHGIHLAGGILGLTYLVFRTLGARSYSRPESHRQAAAGAIATYWHFMDGLWIYLFLLLSMGR